MGVHTHAKADALRVLIILLLILPSTSSEIVRVSANTTPNNAILLYTVQFGTLLTHMPRVPVFWLLLSLLLSLLLFAFVVIIIYFDFRSAHVVNVAAVVVGAVPLSRYEQNYGWTYCGVFLEWLCILYEKEWSVVFFFPSAPAPAPRADLAKKIHAPQHRRFV